MLLRRGSRHCNYCGNRKIQAECASRIGRLHVRLRQHEQAIVSHKEAHGVHVTLCNAHGEMMSLNAMAEIYQSLGRHGEAVALLECAMARCRTSDSRKNLGTLLNNIGVSYRELNRREQARTYYEEAIATQREAGDTIGLAHTLHNLAALFMDNRMYAEARPLLEEACAVHAAKADLCGEGRIQLSIDRLLEEQGAPEEAATYYGKALSAARHPSVRSVEDEAAALHHLAGTALAMNDHSHARHLLQKALDIVIEAQLRSGEAKVLYRYAKLNATLHQHHEALNQLFRARKIEEETGDETGLACTDEAIGMLLSGFGQHALACWHLARAARIREKTGNLEAMANTQQLMGRAREALGQQDEAMRHYQSATFLH
ncbi:MAG TPA: tetratricopeptide repeat protein, partial [Noviherbaspirillum sp.]|uniref:tetratricopeptide repeat protein n=1 Tax=Noviherbaspirillum sp. TaxID=1926288 RepID=UPI002DDD796F